MEAARKQHQAEQQMVQEVYVQRQLRGGNGDTEGISLLRPDTTLVRQLPTSLDKGSLLAQVCEGLAQSHTAFRVFPTQASHTEVPSGTNRLTTSTEQTPE